MKREIGKNLVENFLPKADLTHIVDTSGAYGSLQQLCEGDLASHRLLEVHSGRIGLVM
ncbi:MAG: hypothetical protein Q7R40_12240 [Phaeospirillum sp.]|nr:hypothetical protein [Phaeospirillum sp.]